MWLVLKQGLVRITVGLILGLLAAFGVSLVRRGLVDFIFGPWSGFPMNVCRACQSAVDFFADGRFTVDFLEADLLDVERFAVDDVRLGGGVTITTGTELQEHSLKTDRDIVIGEFCQIDYGLRGADVYVGESSKIGEYVWANGDARIGNWCEIGNDVIAKEDAYIGEGVRINGRLEVNGALDDGPEAINQSCYEAGWLAVIEPSAWDAERPKLLGPAAYFALMQAQIQEDLKGA